MTRVVFTDLDGTLLDSNTYSWTSAQPALDRLHRDGIPCVFVTSKTRAEVELWRRRLQNNHPFIVENGGAAVIPRGYFPFPVPGATEQAGYEAIQWGTPYSHLAACLDSAAKQANCRVRSFHEMTPQEAASACDLPLEEAILAQRREYDEPFLILDRARERELLAAIEAQGLRWTRGGRFYHVLGNNDKAVAVRALHGLFRRSGEVISIGLGDGLNDLPFLEVVDFPVIIQSPCAPELKRRIPHALITRHAGPQGWNQGVLSFLSE